MKIDIEIRNLSRKKISQKRIREIAQSVIKGETKGLSEPDNLELSIALVGLEKIRQLNKKYRKKDFPTDVLSFAGEEKQSGRKKEFWFLGEVIICPAKIAQNAKKANVNFQKELVWAVIHGVFHLLGYDHEKSLSEAAKMREKEKLYLEKFKL